MITLPDPLPDDVDALKALIAEQSERNEALVQENAQISVKVLTLQEQLNLAFARRYAASSEKLSPQQIRLFDEAEVDAERETEEDVTTDEAVAIPAHTRQKGGRKPLPELLPRIDVIHDLAEAERVCPHDGRSLKAIGEVMSEQLDIVPAKIQVLRHVRKQYACDCGQCIRTAALPNQPIPRSLASPGLLAHITVSKYQDALPLYRQENILQRIGVDIPRATLAHWMIKAGALVQPLINLLRDRLLDSDILQMDETTVQVLKESGKTAQSKSYLWVQRGGPPQQPIILFDYDPSRSQAVPVRLLAGYQGYLQTDGYEGYNAVVKTQQLIHVGCMAHARRKFSDAVKAQGKKKKTGKAHQGLAFIQKLYRVERQVQGYSPEERYTYRLAHAQPILTQLRRWLDDSLPQVPPTTATGKALHYLNNQWQKLIRYLEDGRLVIDNNLAENAVRPFVIGRKNFLFSDSVKGVKASANLYSLIETAKAGGLEPYAYLRYVYTHLPAATTAAAIEQLLPENIDAEAIKIY